MPKEGSVQAKTIKFMERSKAAQLCLFIFTMMGACMVIGDGILTPAISGENHQITNNTLLSFAPCL
jgi:K+ transporter